MKNIKYGICQCGCGKKTKIAHRSDTAKGWVKGAPLKYIGRHGNREITKRTSLAAIGNKNISGHGYVRICLGVGLSAYEHTLVAERALGRQLKNYGNGNAKTEVVHHINGIKTDNRPENLLICTHAYHTSLYRRLALSANWPQFKRAQYGK